MLNELIQILCNVYPLSLKEHWNFKNSCVVDDKTNADTLAIFILREISSTFDPSTSTINQIHNAIQALQVAETDIATTRIALRDYLRNNDHNKI